MNDFDDLAKVRIRAVPGTNPPELEATIVVEYPGLKDGIRFGEPIRMTVADWEKRIEEEAAKAG